MATALLTLFPPSRFDQDSAHGLGRGGEEMSAAVPMGWTTADQPEPCLMDQGCGLEGVAGRFLGHLVRCQLAQFLIDQREQFLCGFAIALLDALKDLGDVAHATEYWARTEIKEA